jgi:hypothetical protein
MELNFMKEAKLNPCPPSNTKTGEGDTEQSNVHDSFL